MKNKLTILLLSLLIIFSISVILFELDVLAGEFIDIECISKNVIF